MLAVDVQDLSYSYGGERSQRALDSLQLEVQRGQIFGLLGPNGSGKTTLFRLMATLARIQQGRIQVFGASAETDQATVRGMLGVVFQSPSLDPKLTVLENIQCQAALYGLTRTTAARRIQEVVEQLGLGERLQTRTDELSGGLKRRVELAKGILHRPQLLLMDEPSTGLDPASRLDLWHAIQMLRDQDGVTVLLTTHLLEEADKAEHIAILDQGKRVADGSPQELRAGLGGPLLEIQTDADAEVQDWLAEQGQTVQIVEQRIRVSGAEVAQLVPSLSAAFSERIQTLTIGQPSLEDVFIERTGHRFWNDRQMSDDAENQAKSKKSKR